MTPKKFIVSVSSLAIIAGVSAQAVDPIPGELPVTAAGDPPQQVGFQLSTQDSAAAQQSQSSQSSQSSSKITEISFQGAGDPSRVEIQASGDVEVEKRVNSQDRQIILTIPGATLSKGQNRKIDTSSFSNSNVTMISPYQSEDGSVQIVIQLRQDGDGALTRSGNRIRLAVPVVDQVRSAEAAPVPAPPARVSFGPADGPAGQPGKDTPAAGSISGTDAASAAAATPAMRESPRPRDSMDAFLSNSQTKHFNGKPISLQVRDVDVEDVFRLISEASGFNIILGSDVTGKMTLSLSEVPWDQALDVVLETMHLGADRHGNVLRVVTLQNLALEKTLELKARQASEAIVPKIERVFPISYADIKALRKAILDMAASDATNPIQKDAALAQLTAQAQAASPSANNSLQSAEGAQVKSQAGDVTVIADERTNSLVVRAIPTTMEWIRKLIELLDTQTPQVLIEAKVIEATETFSRSIGGGLGGVNSTTAPTGGFSASNTAGTLLQSLDPLMGTPNTATGQLGSAASLGSGFATGLLGWNFGNASSPRISAILNLAEAESQIKVVSAPKSTVLNKQQAKLVQGTPVIVPTLSTTQFGTQTNQTVAQANLSLTVTPTVTSDGSVLMDLEIDRDTVEAAQGSTQNAQAVAPRSIKTNVLVDNGSTLVLGGFYVSNETKSEGGVPWLKDIPVLGILFGGKNKNTSHDELFFFITPHILNPKKAGLTTATNG